MFIKMILFGVFSTLIAVGLVGSFSATQPRSIELIHFQIAALPLLISAVGLVGFLVCVFKKSIGIGLVFTGFAVLFIAINIVVFLVPEEMLGMFLMVFVSIGGIFLLSGILLLRVVRASS